MATPTRRLAALLAGITDNDQATKVTTAGINADAVTNAQIADNAINDENIAAGQVLADIADGSITTAKIASGVIFDPDPSSPHIKPGILCPAVAGKLLDGTTSHSGAYGTAQADGKSYYYTDIKGSGPIKDPRIGAHFGSQRHKFKSAQRLEQETAAHGVDVYSVDGREWLRTVGTHTMTNDGNGNYFYHANTLADDAAFFEIVGYFSDANYLGTCDTIRAFRKRVDGGTVTAETGMTATISGPLGGRYVDNASLINLGLGLTLGIHTLRISNDNGNHLSSFGIELIARNTQNFTATNASNILTTTGHTLTNGDQIMLTGSDLPNGLSATTIYYVVGVSGNNFQVATSSGGSAVTFSDDGSGTRTWTALNNIKIPSQNVVSYGKKFSISAAETHYDPFNGFVNDTTTFSTRVDTATSLGLGEGTIWGAPWNKGSNNHIRPFNGGRVVKWVDSSGTIKTSVTMMPANAQSSKTTASNEITTASATNSHTINFSDDVIESSLSEVAKSFFVREFGNGSANQGHGTIDWADASFLSSTHDNIGYCMDDGLTSFSGKSQKWNGSFGIYAHADGNSTYITFIGTGISVNYTGQNGSTGVEQRIYVDGIEVHYLGTNPSTNHGKKLVAQNLPYGTHILEFKTITKGNADAFYDEIVIHQPKKPPIPEEAVVLADYMLMADFVGISNGTAGDVGKLSKGVRRISSTRDIFYNAGSGSWQKVLEGAGTAEYDSDGMRVYHNDSSASYQLPYFGTNCVFRGGVASDRSAAAQFKINSTLVTTSSSGTNHSGTQVLNSWATGSGSFQTDNDGSFTMNGSSAVGWASVSGIILGQNTVSVNNTTSSWLVINGFEVASPTHTSHHYQEFETPYLKELIGGDRNMEQTNLICSPDGKTWDEVTRDTSYLGNMLLNTELDGNDNTPGTGDLMPDEWRGKSTAGSSNGRHLFNKDWAIGYDRVICLKDGQYKASFETHSSTDVSGSSWVAWKLNGEVLGQWYIADTGPAPGAAGRDVVFYANRGDYLQTTSSAKDHGYTSYHIVRI